MRCPYCGSVTRVCDSRSKNYFTYRRRECLKCNKRFSTKEISKNGEFMNYKRVILNIRNDMERYIKDLKALVIGVSGGIDSAVCCALARPVCDKLNIPLIGRSIAIETNKGDEIFRAKNIGKYFCTSFIHVDFTDYYKRILKEFESLEGSYDKIARGNLKARLRMQYLYSIAGKNKGLVLSTDNYTEFLLSFFTLHGDVGDLGLIQNLWKTEVYNLAEYLVLFGDLSQMESNALSGCIDAIPTDGLGITNSDLDQILPGWEKNFVDCRKAYEHVDQILRTIIEISGVEMELELKENPIYLRYKTTHFKRNNPYNVPIRIS